VNTIHRPNARRPGGFYHQDELRPFSTRLAAYTAYALMLVDLRSRARSVGAMQRALENNVRLRLGRAAAQIELQSVYDHIAFGLRLPRIPVRLPLRKRVHAAGLASFLGPVPREIRIFPIHGHADKIRRRWKPEDLGVSPPCLVCEILLHETAHIHAALFTSTWDHGAWFVKSYWAVERIMLGFGFEPLLPDRLRLCGCPPKSIGASLQGTKRVQPTESRELPENDLRI